MSVHDDGGPAKPVGRSGHRASGGSIHWDNHSRLVRGQFLSTYVADGIPKAVKIAVALLREMADACSQRGRKR
jgi:hypothetical protein